MPTEFRTLSKRKMKGFRFDALLAEAETFLGSTNKLTVTQRDAQRLKIETCLRDFIGVLETKIDDCWARTDTGSIPPELVNRYVLEKVNAKSFTIKLRELAEHLEQVEVARSRLGPNPQSLVSLFEILVKVPDSVFCLRDFIPELLSESGSRQINRDLLTSRDFSKKFRRVRSVLKEALRRKGKELEVQGITLQRQFERKIDQTKKSLSSAELDQIRIHSRMAVRHNVSQSDLALRKTLDQRRASIVQFRRKRKELLDNFYGTLKTMTLPWKFFPKGEWNLDEVVRHFSQFVRPDERLDPSRLRKIRDNLEPSVCYVGDDGFNRYVAFCFEWTDKVVLECPIVGNAIYVITGPWQEITKDPKWEARRLKEVTVIRHNHSWYPRLASRLRSKL